MRPVTVLSMLSGLILAFSSTVSAASLCSLSHWSGSVGDANDGLLAATPAQGVARYAGDCGLRVGLNDLEPHYVEDQHPTDESRYIARFYLYWGDVGMANGDELTLFSALSSASASVFSLRVVHNNGVDEIRPRVVEDDGVVRNSPSGTRLAEGWNLIELDWSAASAAGIQDGFLTLSLNGASGPELQGLDTDLARVDTVRLGVVTGSPASISGSFAVDAFSSRRGGIIDADGDQIADGADLDDDNDGIPDADEVALDQDPLDPADALQDPDGDGINRLDDYLAARGYRWILKPGLNLVQPGSQVETCQQLLMQMGGAGEVAEVLIDDYTNQRLVGCNHDSGEDFGLPVTGSAFWVRMKRVKAMRTPSPGDCVAQELHAGVNLVGYPAAGQSCYQWLSTLTTNGLQIAALQRFDTDNGRFQDCAALPDGGDIVVVGEDFPIRPGEGYLVSSYTIGQMACP